MISISPSSAPAQACTSSPVCAAVIVVNFGSHALLELNLPAPVPGIEIVVVDNFHSTAERSAVQTLSASHGWSLLPMAGNSGFGPAVNAGVDHAVSGGAEVVVLVNPDARISASALRELIAHCARSPAVLVCPRIVREDGSTWFVGGRILYDQGRTVMADLTSGTRADGWLTGACLAAPVKFWDKVGGFADDYFMYWEDVELSHRWRAAGGTLEVRGDVVAVHAVGGTQTVLGTGRSALYYRFNCRNRLLFAAAHVNDVELSVWVRASWRYARAVVLRGGRRQFLHHPVQPWWSALRGSVEGYRAVRRRRAITRAAGAR